MMRIIAVLAGVIAVLVCVTYNQYKHQTIIEAERDAIKSAYHALAEQYARTEKAYQALSDTKLQITQHYKHAQQAIKQAPDADDAPLAPILRRPLEVKHD